MRSPHTPFSICLRGTILFSTPSTPPKTVTLFCQAFTPLLGNQVKCPVSSLFRIRLAFCKNIANLRTRNLCITPACSSCSISCEICTMLLQVSNHNVIINLKSLPSQNFCALLVPKVSTWHNGVLLQTPMARGCRSRRW